MSGWWWERAACRGSDPELFFPVASCGPVFEAQVVAAKAVCARCPVRPSCLAAALERLPYGIAGGLTEDERRALLGGDTVTGLRQRRASEGRQLLSRGLSTRQVAQQCRVSERTAQRWASRARAEQQEVAS